jgi:hypothetical protein
MEGGDGGARYPGGTGTPVLFEPGEGPPELPPEEIPPEEVPLEEVPLELPPSRVIGGTHRNRTPSAEKSWPLMDTSSAREEAVFAGDRQVNLPSPGVESVMVAETDKRPKRHT